MGLRKPISRGRSGLILIFILIEDEGCPLEVRGYKQIMSLHRSLRSGGATAAKRNVLKRGERVALLKKRGLWKAGSKPVGLPKTKPE